MMPLEDDCWRSIGVAGDRSCAELTRHVHCRNCPRHGDAAGRSLHRPLDAGYREDWASVLARPPVLDGGTDATAMVFRVGAEWLALPLALAASVAPLAPVHRLPHRSQGGALLGVVGVNGRLLPAVSPARLLGITSSGAQAQGRHTFARLLVLASPEVATSFALPVDEIHGVLRHASGAMRPPAATVGHAPPPLVAGIIGDGELQAGLLDGALLMAQLGGLLR